MKAEVLNLLIKWGSNPKEAEKMVNDGFQTAQILYKNSKSMAEFIATCY